MKIGRRFIIAHTKCHQSKETSVIQPRSNLQHDTRDECTPPTNELPKVRSEVNNRQSLNQPWLRKLYAFSKS